MRGTTARTIGLAVAAIVLTISVIGSLGVGARYIPPAEVLQALLDAAEGRGAGEIHEIVVGLRLPRAFVGAIVGSALGVAGALIQALTRNPLADSGILGVNAGAGFLVTIGIGWFGVSDIQGYVWFAFSTLR